MVDSGTIALVARVFNVVGFAGSLRRGSYNRALLRAATELAPPALHIVIQELDGIPLYNADIEATGAPLSVVQPRDGRSAGGWAAHRHARIQPRRSRRAEKHDRLAVQTAPQQRIERQVAALMGASPGMTGTARGQSQLRQAFVFTNTYALLQPEALVGRAHEKFDAEGRLAHQATRDFLATFLQRFTDLIARSPNGELPRAVAT